jgi:diguanylate cyclase (GGDEF)-like protein
LDVQQAATLVESRTIGTPRLGQAYIALRWLIVATYVALARWDVLDISGEALLLSAGLLGAYQLTFTWDRLAPGTRPWPRLTTSYADVLMVTTALIALHDVESPVWALYFTCIIGVAHIATPRQMVAYVVFAISCDGAAAGIVAALGHHVSYGYVVVVGVVLAFLGWSGILLAGAEQRVRDVIAKVAVTDSLTGLPNRRSFQQIYAESIDAAISARTPLTLMLVDVDHFKLINDIQGHPAGDDKLRELAQAFGGVMRKSDVVARYGGDEFIVVAPDTARGDAVALAERLRGAAVSCGISVSVGVALFPDDAAGQDVLVDAADRALYRAKEAGRDCVRLAA